jgi:L-asparagine oxygenase
MDCVVELGPNEVLDTRIRQTLRLFLEKGTETGYLLFRCGLDEDLPPTPPDNTYHLGEHTYLAKIQRTLISVMGEMIAYEAEGAGRLFQDVVPTQTMATVQTSLGSHRELEIHTEQAFSKWKPDILSLACLRGDANALTYVLPVRQILRHTTPEEQELLRQPLWNTGVDLSFRLNGCDFIDGDIRGPFPIIQGSLEDPILVFDQDLMTGVTEQAQQMISKIIDIYFAHRSAHCLQPGEILMIDNRRAVHGRSPFFPKYDGNDRFLIRCFAVLDYAASECAREGRVVKAIYS